MLGASEHHNRVKNVKTFLHLWLRQILSSFLLFTGPEFFWCLIILLYKTAFQSFAVIFSCRRFSQHTSIIINTIKQIFINQLMSERKVRFCWLESWCRIGEAGFKVEPVPKITVTGSWHFMGISSHILLNLKHCGFLNIREIHLDRYNIYIPMPCAVCVCVR